MFCEPWGSQNIFKTERRSVYNICTVFVKVQKRISEHYDNTFQNMCSNMITLYLSQQKIQASDNLKVFNVIGTIG